MRLINFHDFYLSLQNDMPSSPYRLAVLLEIEEDSTEQVEFSPLMPASYLKFSENAEYVISKAQEKILLIKLFLSQWEPKRRQEF